MTVTFAQAMYLCALAAFGGGIIALAARQSIQAWREAGDEIEAGERAADHGISHVPAQNFRGLTPKMREKLHKIPNFAEVEAIKLANFAHAEKVRREAMMARPVEAGMAEVGS